MAGTIDTPPNPRLQAAINKLNDSAFAIKEAHSLSTHEMLLALVGLTAMYAASANDHHVDLMRNRYNQDIKDDAT